MWLSEDSTSLVSPLILFLQSSNINKQTNVRKTIYTFISKSMLTLAATWGSNIKENTFLNTFSDSPYLIQVTHINISSHITTDCKFSKGLFMTVLLPLMLRKPLPPDPIPIPPPLTPKLLWNLI